MVISEDVIWAASSQASRFTIEMRLSEVSDESMPFVNNTSALGAKCRQRDTCKHAWHRAIGALPASSSVPRLRASLPTKQLLYELSPSEVDNDNHFWRESPGLAEDSARPLASYNGASPQPLRTCPGAVAQTPNRWRLSACQDNLRRAPSLPLPSFVNSSFLPPHTCPDTTTLPPGRQKSLA
nr:hypothetical protein CFP56_02896 [Quercus suber]